MASFPSSSMVEGTRGELLALVRHFDRDAGRCGRLIRELLGVSREAFYNDAIEVLRTQDESRGSQYLVSMLAGDQLLLPALSDPRLTREQALAAARAAVRASVMVDVLLAKYLAERAPAIGEGQCPPEMQRLMDILADISDGSRILPYLVSLTRLQNPHLGSKAVLMMGRINRNVRWVQNRLADPDSRVRANAIEALWGIDTEEARALLRFAAHDADNRVAGNALIALYRLGDAWAIAEMVKMAEHESRRFRATAAWAMGESGDPRFARALARMVGEPNVAVRTRAFAALGKIKTASAQSRQAGEFRVVARFQRSRRNGWRELQVDVSAQDGQEQIKALPTQIILFEDGQEVVNYSVEERQPPPGLAITFLHPRTSEQVITPFQQGALHALQWKRPSDLWSVACYIPAAREVQTSLAGQKIQFAAEPALPEANPPQFTCDPEVATAALERVPPKVDCADLWNSIRRAVQVEGGPARGQRHIVVFGQSETGQPAGYADLASAAMASRTVVHAISLIANPSLEGLCQMTKGTFHLAPSADEVEGIVEQVYLSLMARHLVCYQPVSAEGRELRIILNAPSGWGEETIAIPRRAGRVA